MRLFRRWLAISLVLLVIVATISLIVTENRPPSLVIATLILAIFALVEPSIRVWKLIASNDVSVLNGIQLEKLDSEESYLQKLISELESKLKSAAFVDDTEKPNDFESILTSWHNEYRFEELLENKNTDSVRLSIRGITELIRRHDRFVLLGEPGSGKTTILRSLVKAFAQMRLDKTVAIPMPLLLDLPKWASMNGNPSIDDFIRSSWQLRSNPLEMMKNGDIVVCLDGLNEMGQKASDRICKLQQWLLSDHAPQKLIIACRQDDYKDVLTLSELPTVIVQKLDDDEIIAFANRYLGQKAQGFFDQLRSKNNNQALWELLRNPYMLSAFAFVYSETDGQNSPSSRIVVFDRLMHRLWNRELDRRHIRFHKQTEYVTGTMGNFSFKEAVLAFGRVAFMMTKDNMASEVPYQYFVKHLSFRNPKVLLKIGLDANWIEVRGNTVQFYHQLMQEYFAAIYLEQIAMQPFKIRFSDFTRTIHLILMMPDKRATLFSALVSRTFSPENYIQQIAHWDYYDCISPGDRKWKPVASTVCCTSTERRKLFQFIVSVNPFLASFCLVVCQNNEVQVDVAIEKIVVDKLLDMLGNPESVSTWAKLVIECLEDIQTSYAIDKLLYILEKDNFDGVYREWAAQALGRTANVSAVNGLVAAFYDDDTEVAWFSALALARLGSAAIPSLVEALQQNRTERVHANAQTALIRIGCPAVPALGQMLYDVDTEVRKRAAYPFTKIICSTFDESYINQLIFIIQQQNIFPEDTQRAALERLDEIEDIPSLIIALNQSSLFSRPLSTLKRIGTPVALAAIDDWYRKQNYSRE